MPHILLPLDGSALASRHLGLTVVPAVREGRLASVLLETAEQGKCSLLVVATHGRSLLTRWLLGSVELLHASPLPLLVVR